MNSQHIGIVACSAEGAALCYRTICLEAQAVMGEHQHPEISMHTHALGLYTPHFPSKNWHAVAELMIDSARKVAGIGANFAICPDNTIHEAFDEVVRASPIPWLHIADAVADEAQALGFKRLGITGTKFLMTGPVYPSRLKPRGLAWETPVEADRERINDIIFGELVNGKFTEKSRRYFNEVIQSLKDRGCDAVVLGCTEIPLLVDPNDCPLPVLDSTRLLAQAAIRWAPTDRREICSVHETSVHYVSVHEESVMRNITLSADERLIDAARERARAEHTTLNEQFRRWLADYTQRDERAERVRKFDELMTRLQKTHTTGGRKFTRDEMNER
jgi:aspartate racemase